jgi:hypothetical protein
MAENNVLEQKIPVAVKSGAEDLSGELEKVIQRLPDERLKVVRVFDNYYRCNLWAADKSNQAFWLATGVIKESKFLRVTKTTAGLQIEDMSPAGKRV